MTSEPILQVEEVTKTFGGIIALNRLSFDVAEGEILGIIGPNGSGKSTIMRLLCRLYDVNEGAVLVDGTDIREYRLRPYRRNVAVVHQDVFLFGRQGATEGRAGKLQNELGDALAAAREEGSLDAIVKKWDERYVGVQ